MLRRWLSRLNSKPSDEPSELRITEDDLNLYTLSDWGRKEQALYGFKARHGIDPWPLNLPLDWSQDPFKDTNWKFSLHSWRMTDPILREYFRTGNPDLLLDSITTLRREQQSSLGMTWLPGSVHSGSPSSSTRFSQASFNLMHLPLMDCIKWPTTMLSVCRIGRSSN
jgi:hypothetical protein